MAEDIVGLYFVVLIGMSLWYVNDGVEEDNWNFAGSLISIIFWPITVPVIFLYVWIGHINGEED